MSKHRWQDELDKDSCCTCMDHHGGGSNGCGFGLPNDTICLNAKSPFFKQAVDLKLQGRMDATNTAIHCGQWRGGSRREIETHDVATPFNPVLDES